MAVMPLVMWPDPRLARRAAEVTEFDSMLAGLARDMLDTMYAAPGRGLAGPQVGEMVRIFVMDCGWKDGAPDPRVMVNPVILCASGAATRDEGCLSVPGLAVPVTRPDRLTLRWQELSGDWREEVFDGFAATCIQHERDHLDGILHLDRAAPADRAAALAQLDGPARLEASA
ncbi:peptide deformylase [Frigidibacter sp. MR17.24]|uniref:peptide deformylase n=1 Tax=Frigidibacter sp. MR17.24 TaxID=3127345 RepID=UPI003012B3DA